MISVFNSLPLLLGTLAAPTSVILTRAATAALEITAELKWLTEN